MKKDIGMCLGCENNFYNGNNPYGVKRCWSFATAKVVSKRRVPIWMTPPWTMPPEPMLSCRKDKGYAMISETSQEKRDRQRKKARDRRMSKKEVFAPGSHPTSREAP
jgi:hypothetical protein